MVLPFLRGRDSRPHSITPRALLLAAGLIALWPPATPAQAPATPAQTPPAPVRVIEVKGRIRPDLLPQLRSALETADPERYPAGAVLFLDSPGGDGLAAIEAGRLVRAARAHVFVRGRCASACVFLLAAGVVRGAADLSVGIHRPRLTTFVKGIGVVDINPNSNPNAAKALEVSDRRAEEYLREMGMPDSLHKAMLATPSDQMRKLTSAELAEFGLTGVDPGYAEMRAPGAAARYGIAREAFSLRAPQVQEKCVTGEVVARDFVRCYSRVLRTGE